MSTHRSGYFKKSYAEDIKLLDTPWRVAFLAALGACALIAPFVISGHVLHILNLMYISIMGALALNMLTGYAGQISLGHAAFMAIGAVSSHWLANKGLPFIVVVPTVMLIGGVLGVVVGAPALRLRGLYLVVATVGLHYVVAFIITEYQTGGDMLQALTGLQMPVPDFGYFRIDSPHKWYFALLLILVLVTAFCVNLARTKPGRAWIALRDRDITAAALGINVAYYKILAFVVSSALTCMTGSLLVYFIGSVSVEYFTLTLAITYLAMVVIGGAGSIAGAYLGAIFVGVLPHAITGVFEMFGTSARTSMTYVVPSQIVVFGLVMILFLILEPKGLVGIWGRIRTYFEMWPLRQSILTERK